MHDDDIIWEIGLEGHHDLPCQRDFRHEHDDLPPRGPHFFCKFNVDLRLAAARDALQQEAVILPRRQRGLHGREGPLLVLRQLLDIRPPRRGLAIAIAQYAPLPQLDERWQARREFFRELTAEARRLQFRHTRRLPHGHVLQQLLLCLLAGQSRERLLRHFAQPLQVRLEAGRFALCRHILPPQHTVTQELGEDIRQLLFQVGQRLRELLRLVRALPQQVVVDLTVVSHPQQHVLPLLRHRCIGHGDLQAALARHEEAHDFRQRAKVEICQPFRRLEHGWREPRLLIDGARDILELSQQLRIHVSRILLLHREDEALHLAPAEGHKNAPAHPDETELVWHAIGKSFGDALDGNIHENAGGQQNISSSNHRKRNIASQSFPVPILAFSPGENQSMFRPTSLRSCTASATCCA